MMTKSRLMTKFSEKLKTFKQPAGEQQELALQQQQQAAPGRCDAKQRKRSRAGGSLLLAPPPLDSRAPISLSRRAADEQRPRRKLRRFAQTQQVESETRRDQQSSRQIERENQFQVMSDQESGHKSAKNFCRQAGLFASDTNESETMSSTKKTHDHEQREQRRRKVAISNFIMILFGIVATLCCVTLASCSLDLKLAATPDAHNNQQLAAKLQQSNKNLTTLAALNFNRTSDQAADTTATTTTTTSNRLLPLAAKINANDDEAGDDMTLTSDSTVADATSVTATTISDNSEDSEDLEESTTGAGNNRTRLGEAILDSADSGADLLVKHLSPKQGDDEPVDDQEGDKPAALASSSSTENKSTNQTREQELRFALDTYEKWRTTADDLIELFSRKLLPIIMEHGYDVDTSTVSGLLQVFNGIRGLRPWALKLLDASAKLTTGLLVGTQSDFGDFDECLNVRVDDPSGLAAANSDFPQEIDSKTGLPSTTLVGRYCLADVEFPKPPRVANERTQAPQAEVLNGGYLPIELRRPLLNFSETAFKDTIWVETANFFHMLYVDPIRVGICLTNKIDPDNFQQVFNKLIEEFQVTINFRGRCVTKYDQREQWTVYQLVSAYTLVVVCALVVASTLIELVYRKWDKLPRFGRAVPSHKSLSRARTAFEKYRPLVTSFSLIRNTKRLFKAPKLSASSIAKLQDSQPTTADQRQKSNLIQILGQQQHQRKQQVAVSSASTTDSSIAADSSVESSPSIERRSSSIDAGSAVHLISSANSATPTSSLYNFNNNNNNNQLIAHHHQQQAGNCECASSAAADDSINLLNLHGIRVITMTWMIVNHTYLFGGFFVLWAHRRLIDIAEWPKSISFQLVLNGWLTVETYFFLSALIIVLNLMPMMRRRRFNYFSYILHRLIRLMPAYVGLVSLNFLWPRISSGPVWLVKGKSFIQTPCENYLWTNFLFINNWIWPEKQCMVHTWFLSADFQLYLFAPIIVYLLYRRPALGHSMNLIVAIIASIFSGLVIYANELLPATLINKLEFDSIKQQLSYSYFATYQHMGPYCLGILTGYLLYKRPNIRLPKHLTWLLWILLPPLSFTTLLLTYLWNGAYSDPDLINPSPIVSAVYVAIHRTIWTSLVAWIVFACSTGRAKMLSNFLSHSMFIPLSRLSFSIYLVHLPVIMFRSLNIRHTVEWTDSNILWEACGNFVFSLIMGYFLNVAFESPIINLENFIFGRDRTATKESNTAGQHKRQNLGAQMLGCGESAEKLRNASSILHAPSERRSSLSLQKQSCLLLNDDSGSDNKLSSSNKTTSQSTINNDDDHRSDDQSSNGRDRAGNSLQSASHERHPPRFTGGAVAEQTRTSRAGSLRSVPKQLSAQLASSLNGPTHQLAFKRNWDDVGSKINYERSNASELQGKNLTTNQLIEQRRLNNLRLLAANERAHYRMQRETSATNGGRHGDDLYNIMGEYQHYAPGSYQRWRMSSGLSNGRPKQYATLARTSHLDSSRRLEQFDHMSRPARQRLLTQADFGNQSPALKYNPTSTDTHALDGADLRTGERQLTTLGGQGPVARRPGRYNTLTGTGTGDWRLQYEKPYHNDYYLNSWNRATMDQQQPVLETPTSRPRPDWTESPMLPIPRIDSSTLRRQSRRNEAAESSIVEEPADEESSDL